MIMQHLCITEQEKGCKGSHFSNTLGFKSTQLLQAQLHHVVVQAIGCTATYLHCCILAPPLKCTTAGFHNWPIFQEAALSAKVLQNSQSKQSTNIFC